MLLFNKLLLLLLVLNFIFPISLSKKIPLNHCGSITLQPPFSNPNSSLLTHMILCKSNILYFRTTIGLFQITSIDYTNKLLTISHKPRSSVSEFVSPHHLSAGLFPFPSSTNSLILFNCSINQRSNTLFTPCDLDREMVEGLYNSSCFLIDDVGKLENSFHPKEMNCTHYSRVFKRIDGRYEIGSRIGFDVDHVPDHVPNPCDECEKSNGNCGVALRCVCHPKLCRDKVISFGEVLKPCGNILNIYLIFFFVLMTFF